MSERRKCERTPTAIRVEMLHPAFGALVGFTRDISDGGAQVVVENQVCPPVGTVVNVRFSKVAGPVNAEPVPMRVMHSFRGVLGLMFVS